MWTRAELKDRAKQDMKPFYWYGVLVCFIAGILGAGSSGGGGIPTRAAAYGMSTA